MIERTKRVECINLLGLGLFIVEDVRLDMIEVYVNMYQKGMIVVNGYSIILLILIFMNKTPPFVLFTCRSTT